MSDGKHASKEDLDDLVLSKTMPIDLVHRRAIEITRKDMDEKQEYRYSHENYDRARSELVKEHKEKLRGKRKD
jgi:hypothetical protein